MFLDLKEVENVYGAKMKKDFAFSDHPNEN